MLKFHDKMALYSDDIQHCQIFFPTCASSILQIVSWGDTSVELLNDGESDCADFTCVLKVPMRETKFMSCEMTEEYKALLEECDFAFDGIFITFDKNQSKPTLVIKVADEPASFANMKLVGNYFEVVSSTLTELNVYRTKFLVERNTQLLIQLWGE